MSAAAIVIVAIPLTVLLVVTWSLCRMAAFSDRAEISPRASRPSTRTPTAEPGAAIPPVPGEAVVIPPTNYARERRLS